MNDEHKIIQQVYAAKDDVLVADQLIGTYTVSYTHLDVYKRQVEQKDAKLQEVGWKNY